MEVGKTSLLNSNAETKSKKNCVYLRKILIISVVINLILLTIITILLLIRDRLPQNVSNNQTDSYKSDTIFTDDLPDSDSLVCLSCEYLGPTVESRDTLYDVIIKSEKGRKICCYKNEEFRRLLNRMPFITNKENAIFQNRNNSMDFKWWRSRQDAAHLEMDTSKTSSLWSSSSNSELAFSNLKVTNNRLQILKEGVYFVYAVFSFDFGEGDIEIPLIYHNITRQHPMLKNSGPEVLFMNKYGGFSTNSNRRYTSFLSGLIHLHPHFEVATQVSNSYFLDQKPYSNYFGIFKI